ncbi:hypothetical protein [Streptomyces sp. NBC_00878]|uniref:hypothetical protein n=1 Tax=Streptomyces sp. NBC_00878 TaxID=2975854 RepID=UPI00224E4BAB|nr:hypothetical protein [Streptomyces sp. NBC_00878]MCX4911823.1 hypothetical protein [Streptomyces sp. NBC_00878]
MSTAIMTAAAALAGVLLSALITNWQNHTDRKRQQQDQAAKNAEALLGALAEHRQHQYLKIQTRRRSYDETKDDLKDRYAARTHVTRARAAFLRTNRDPHLLELARQAVDTSFALGDTPDNQLQAAGDLAREAHNALQNAAFHNRRT